MKNAYNFKQLLAAACMSLVLFGISITTLGSIMPYLTEKFALSELDLGTLASLLPIGLLVGSLFFGPIVDRYSYKYLLILCSAILLLSLEGIALAPSYEILGVFFFTIGLGGGAINGGASALVADISSDRPNARSANLSIVGVFFGIGALGMPSLLGLLAQRFGYQDTIMVVGAALSLPILYFLAIPFPPPKHAQKIPVKEGFAIARDLTLILLGFILFFQSAVEGLINNWTTTYLIQIVGTSESQALFALSAFVLSLTLSRLVCALVIGPVRPYLVMIVAILLVMAGILVLNYTHQYEMALLGLVLLGTGLAPGFPIILGYVGDLYARVSGTAFSLVFVIAIVGNILWNYLMGHLANAYGFASWPPFILGSVVMLAVILYITIKRISNKTRV